MGKRNKRKFELADLTQADLMSVHLTPSEEAFIAKNKQFIEDLIVSHQRIAEENKKLRKDVSNHVATIKKLRKHIETNNRKPVSKKPKRQSVAKPRHRKEHGVASKVHSPYTNQ